MKWFKVKKLVESRFADSVKGRVSLFFTRYRHNDCVSRAAIRVDGKELINMSECIFYRERNRKEEVEYGPILHSYGDLHGENIFIAENLLALFAYPGLSVKEILSSNSPIIRAIGMLDRRVGKRTLCRFELETEPEIVRRLWRLRCEAENLLVPSKTFHDEPEITSKIRTDYWSKQHKLKFPNRDDSLSKLALSKRTRDIPTFLTLLLKNVISQEEVTTSTSQIIFSGFKQCDDPELFSHSVEHLLSCTKLLRHSEYVNGVMAVINDHHAWRQPLWEWRPRTHSPRKQFASLVRILFAEYDVPLFMDKAWLKNSPLHQSWFKHLGTGKNIRSAEGMPVVLTKKMAHYFLTAPETYSIEAAIRWGQIFALGGDRRLADAILDTRLVTAFVDDPFCLSVLQFFIRNPMLDSVWINPIIDYIWNQKYVDRIEFTEAGVAENVGPAQPGFSMRGRNVNSLVKHVEAWHEQLGRGTKHQRLTWKKSKTKDFQFVEGRKETRNMQIWRIRELLSSSELAEEGRQLKHCVSSYAGSCAAGSNSIWTLERQTEDGVQKLLTIEVRLSDSSIRQIRGFGNRMPNQKEKEVIRRWMTAEGLQWFC